MLILVIEKKDREKNGKKCKILPMQRYAPIFNLSTRDIEKDEPLMLDTACVCVFVNDDRNRKNTRKPFTFIQISSIRFRQKNIEANAACRENKTTQNIEWQQRYVGKMQIPFSFCDVRMSWLVHSFIHPFIRWFVGKECGKVQCSNSQCWSVDWID